MRHVTKRTTLIAILVTAVHEFKHIQHMFYSMFCSYCHPLGEDRGSYSDIPYY